MGGTRKGVSERKEKQIRRDGGIHRKVMRREVENEIMVMEN